MSVSLPVSDILITHKLIKDRAWVLDRLKSVVGYAKDKGLYVCAGAEDASRADEGFLAEYFRIARGAGADRLRFADTVGVLDPFLTSRKIARLMSVVDVPVEVHTHNDFGLATANALAGVHAGAEYVSTTVLGIGERAGNAALEEVVMATKHIMGEDTSVDPARLLKLCGYVAKAAGRSISPGKPVVGGGIFHHESGIHADGVIKLPTAYEAYPPEEVGLSRDISIGKHSGRAALVHRFRGMGISISGKDAAEMLMEVRCISVGLKRGLSDAELLKLYEARPAA